MGDVSTSRLRDELIALLEEKETRPRSSGSASCEPTTPSTHTCGPTMAGRGSPRPPRRAARSTPWTFRVAPGPDRARRASWRPTSLRLLERRRSAVATPERIAGAVVVAPRVVERLRTERSDPAEVVALCDPYAPDAPLYALALSDLPPLHAYFERLREVRRRSPAPTSSRSVSRSPRASASAGRAAPAEAERRSRRARLGAGGGAGADRAGMSAAADRANALRVGRVPGHLRGLVPDRGRDALAPLHAARPQRCSSSALLRRSRSRTGPRASRPRHRRAERADRLVERRPPPRSS